MADEPPSSKWRAFAGDASRWALKAAKVASTEGMKLAKAAGELAREEIERQQQRAAERAEKARLEAIAEAEQQRLPAEQAVRDTTERPEGERREAVEREPGIRAFFADRMNVISQETGTQEDHLDIFLPSSKKLLRVDFKVNVRIKRSLSAMSSREVTLLLFIYLFRSYGFLNNPQFYIFMLSIIYNDGSGDHAIIEEHVGNAYAEKYGIANTVELIKYTMATFFGVTNKEAGISAFLARFSEIQRNSPDHPIVKEFHGMLIGGNRWLTDQSLSQSPFTTDRPPGGLFIGRMESGKCLWFGAEGSLITVAPPGSGKTQCHVFPNLLTYEGPAIVLDVKGECYDKTEQWRRENVGPVFRFNPLNPADSARYNPLAFIVNDPDTLWEECRLMADLLIVPKAEHEPYFENRARDLVTGILAWLARTLPPEHRSMSKISDVVNKVVWSHFLEAAQADIDLPPLSRIGHAFAAMPEKQLESVLDAARQHLAVWEGPRVERVTATCDWTPEVLRDGSNATIYICISPSEIESYAPLLRVIFAQHLRQLMAKLPPRGQRPILFMLDELPRLGPMRAVEEGLEVGRQYGIRLWMFVQSLGQLERAYKNADGMVGSCAVRVYMNPSAHDGTAKRLSEELGYVESIIDGSRNLLVEPASLAGPDYADYQLALATSARPAKLRKVYAYRDQEFQPRLPRRP